MNHDKKMYTNESRVFNNHMKYNKSNKINKSWDNKSGCAFLVVGGTNAELTNRAHQ